MSDNKPGILIGSSVLQKPQILKAFLRSLKELDTEGIRVEYMFVDDNKDEVSSEMLKTFQGENNGVRIISGENPGNYVCDEVTHYWNNSLMDRVGSLKNRIIDYAAEREFDYLFFVDSDLVLNKKLLKHLVSAEKDIVSEIFWTKWVPASEPEPNVWLYDQYNLSRHEPSERLSSEEALRRKNEFLKELKIPGIYKVGGLGACTLISKKALTAGVNFSRIENLRLLWGEDRFFCIRAVILGFELYADSFYPAYHIYREADLAGVEDYIQRNNADTPV